MTSTVCVAIGFHDGPASQRRKIAENLILTGILAVQLTGTTCRLGGWSELTEVEEAVAAAELRGSRPGAGDLLAEVAAVFERAYEGNPMNRSSGKLQRCSKAGADP